jgi:cell division protease FtsH
VFLGRDLFESQNYSDEIAYEIDKEVRRIIDECYSRARAVLTEHKESLDRIAKTLLERESLQSDELETLIAGQPLLPDLPALAPSTPSLVSQDVTAASDPEKPIPPTLKPDLQG